MQLTLQVTYIFDSSAWISAWNELYSPKVFPVVWKHIVIAVENGAIASPQQVIKEIVKGGDELSKWVKDHRQALKAPLLSDYNQNVENRVARLRNDYPELSTRTGADYYVIAWAKELKSPLVATENPKASSKRALAGVCQSEKIPYKSPLQFMQDQQWVFP